MRLNGAFRPHGAFPYVGSSIGAKNRDYCLNRNSYKGSRKPTEQTNNKNTRSSSSKNNQNKIQSNYSSLYSRKHSGTILGMSLKIMRIQQSKCFMLLFSLLYVLCLLPNRVLCDNADNDFFVRGFSLGPEMTTPEFDYASRGSKKFGDKCESTLECGFPGSICDPKMKSCQCTDDLGVTNHIDKCGKEAAINESCFFNEQCEAFHFQTECRDGRCICRFDMAPTINKDGNIECRGKQEKREPERYVDPAMIGVLVGMALMFIIICVVLRLFSRARWRENRTIFNTPNPRLMNVSLLRENKLLHGQERRGSRMSVRVPSRQPSMASLRPHSPNPSLGKTGSRRDSRASSSNNSATSTRSNRSNAGVTTNLINGSNHEMRNQHSGTAHQPLVTPNITTNPASDNVTIEIIEPKS